MIMMTVMVHVMMMMPTATSHFRPIMMTVMEYLIMMMIPTVPSHFGLLAFPPSALSSRAIVLHNNLSNPTNSSAGWSFKFNLESLQMLQLFLPCEYNTVYHPFFFQSIETKSQDTYALKSPLFCPLDP